MCSVKCDVCSHKTDFDFEGRLSLYVNPHIVCITVCHVNDMHFKWKEVML